MSHNHCAMGRRLAEWKAKIAEQWGQVTLTMVESAPRQISTDANFTVTVSATLGELRADDVAVECLFQHGERGRFQEDGEYSTLRLQPLGEVVDGRQLFRLDAPLNLSGIQNYRIRIYPSHPALVHRFESGFMLWLGE